MTSFHDDPRSDRARGLSLGELVEALAPVRAKLGGEAARRAEARAADVQHDSRKVRPGDVFAALPGAHTHGLEHVEQALASGAAAILVESGASSALGTTPRIEVGDIRLALALAAEAVNGRPSRSVKVAAITGTNGKTTTVWLLEHALWAIGQRAGRVGTIGYAFGDCAEDCPLTTPEADDISRFAHRVVDGGGTHLLMEASSHALAQRRIDGLELAAAAFTNLTQDHLDYHGTMAAYAAAKRRLFAELSPRAAAINVEDPFGQELAAAASSSRVLRVGKTSAADVYPLSARMTSSGIEATVELPSGAVELVSPLVGDHNLDNLLMTLAMVEALDLDVSAAAGALRGTPAVPGRLERCDAASDDITVLVDYAHTPDALRRVLDAVRGLTQGELVCVFGCGGDRDPGKRPKMGEAVAAAADRAILTTDNPRTEAPEDIARAVEPGLARHPIRYEVVLDRTTAIERAVVEARPGDVVLVAGKGHEPYQIIGTRKFPYDDRIVARRALEVRRGKDAR
ncbi:MAG: UDP-N-acetylmuramoyl-L-alanyl-D-glutamate--2,6-diaminopimelate ligase [Polyangiaceae bacterium]|nr:UDP-N-acetylmuramoyl-L-alanyl-D-glutamate--2,6-diaminopimelate ligase [Polyangiaceae bacterium]